MTLDPQALIDGYLDETLSSEEHVAFSQWLHEPPQHGQRSAEAVLLHDRLQGEFLAMSTPPPELHPAPSAFAHSRPRRRMGSAATFFGAVCTLAVLITVL